MRLIILALLVCTLNGMSRENDTYELWDINSLSSIGGHSVSVTGNPVVVKDSILGDAVKFDGSGDMLIINSAPIDSAKNFTIEAIFKPDGNNLNILNQPRFLCFWDPNDASSGPRITIEIRVTSSKKWYFDGFLKTDAFNLTLIDSTKTHDTDQWMHVAVVYQDSTFKTFVNGIEELSGKVGYNSKVLNPSGKVSVGARFNSKNWYSGLIKTIKVSKSALAPSEFITDMLVPKNMGIDEVNNEFRIFPIPARNELNVEWQHGSPSKQVQVTIFTVTGKKVLSEKFLGQKIILGINNLQNGLYLVNLRGIDFTYTQKIEIIR